MDSLCVVSYPVLGATDSGPAKPKALEQFSGMGAGQATNPLRTELLTVYEGAALYGWLSGTAGRKPKQQITEAKR